jgi:hypothetical protein
MTYRVATRKLKALGCQELPRRGTGSHRKWFNPATQRITTLPDWEARTLRSAQFEPRFASSVWSGPTSKACNSRSLKARLWSRPSPLDVNGSIPGTRGEARRAFTRTRSGMSDSAITGPDPLAGYHVLL